MALFKGEEETGRHRSLGSIIFQNFFFGRLLHVIHYLFPKLKLKLYFPKLYFPKPYFPKERKTLKFNNRPCFYFVKVRVVSPVFLHSKIYVSSGESLQEKLLPNVLFRTLFKINLHTGKGTTLNNRRLRLDYQL